MKTKSPVVASLLVLLLCLTPFFLGCGSKAAPGTISIVASSSSIAAGVTTQLRAIDSVNNQGTDVTTSVTWSSSNAKVATVSATGMLTAVTPGSATIGAVLNTANGALSFSVTAASVSSVAIAPQNYTLTTGATEQYTLTATNTDSSTTDVSASTAWSVTPASVATISNTGVLTAVGPGSYGVSATYGTFTASAIGVVTASSLTSIAVTPATATLSAGSTQQFIATGTFADGSTGDLTKTVTWTSSNVSVLTINVNGLATAARTNNPATNVKVIAEFNNLSATAAVTVNPAASITSLVVEPTSSSIANGSAEQSTATATYSDGTQQDVTSQVTWSVAANTPSIAKGRTSGARLAHANSSGVVAVNQSGIDSATTPGIATLQATLGGAQSQSTVIVTNATVTGLSVKADSTQFPVGSTQQFQLIGTFSDGSTQDLTLTANWQSSNPAVATISPSTGVATGVSAGPVTFSGSFGGLQASITNATVLPRTLLSTVINVNYPLQPLSSLQQLQLLGTYNDGTVHDITAQATWTSSNPSSVTVSSSGVAFAVTSGSTQIIGTAFGQSTLTNLTVGNGHATGITIIPANPTLVNASTEKFSSIIAFNTGGHADLSSSAIWTSSDPTILTVDGSGNVKAGKVGTATITATFQGQTGTSTPITVTNPTLARLNITPATQQIAAGTNQQFAVTGYFGDGSIQDLTTSAIWTTSDGSTAAVDSVGTVDGLQPGTVQVSATFWGQTVSSALTISNAILNSVSMTPSNSELPAGTDRFFQLIGNFSDGTTQDLSPYGQWFATQPLTVTEVNSGQVSAITPGIGAIGAQFGNFKASTPVTVTNATLSSMSVLPASITLRQGQTQQLNVVGSYSDGYSQSLVLDALVTTGNRQIVDIDQSFNAYGTGVGSTQLTCTFKGMTVVVPVTVLSSALSALSISPSSPALNSGTQQQLVATGTYIDGVTSDVSSSVVWTSSNPNVLNVDQNGLLTAYATNSAVSATITAQSGSASQSVRVTVYPAGITIPTSPLTALYVLPTSDRLEVGTAIQLSAVGYFGDGSFEDLSNAVSWSSANPGLVTVSGSGLATGVTAGITTVQAQAGSIQSQTSIVVGPGTIASASINPGGSSFAVGAAQQLTLAGYFSDGVEQNLNPVATWTSSTQAVATVSASGVVTGVAPGTAQITGTALGQTVTTTVVITSATLVSLTVVPSAPSFAVGTTQQFSVLANYSDGSIFDITAASTFASSNTSVITVSSKGVATGVIPGSAQVTATFGGQTGTTQSVTVTPATLVSITVRPDTDSFAYGTARQFWAIGLFSDGTTQNLSNQAIWTSSNPQALTIDQYGWATGGNSGTAAVTAALEGIFDTTGTIQVTPATLIRLAISPTSASIANHTAQQFTATGTFSDGSTQDLSKLVSWSSSNGAVVTINGNGLATGNSPGSAQLTATYRNFTVSTSSFQVTSATLVSISFNPANPSLAPGTNTQVTVTGTFSDGTTENLSSSAIYSSSNTAVATVSTIGVITAVGQGTTTITVQVDGQTSTFTVTVTGATLSSIAITPASPAAMPNGSTQQFTATGTYSDGSTQDLTQTATWSSTNTSILTINGYGLATGVSVGSAQITAAYQGQTATTPIVQVTAAALASITVTPANTSINTGGTQQYTATGTYTNSTTQNLTSSVTWSSSSTSVATITTTGLAAGLVAGSANITAQLNSISGSTGLAVTTPSGPNPNLVSIVVVPTSSQAAAGTSVQFNAIGFYSNGSIGNISNTVTWSSSNSAIGSVGVSGLATGIVPGTATIEATSGTLHSQATLIVSAAILTSVAISPSGSSFAIGAAQQLTLTGTFSDGTTQNLNASATWASLAPTVATASTSGVVTGVSSGTAQITASFDGFTASSTVTITQATLVSISVFPNHFNFADGTAQQFTVIGTYSDGSTHDVTGTATFVSSNPAVISVSTSGLVTAISTGSAQVTVTFDGQTVTTQTITVTSATLTSIAITPNTATFADGTTQQFTAIGTFSNGTTQNLTNQVIWSSSNPQFITINQYGYAEGGGSGSAQITATFNSVSATTSSLQVTSATLTGLSISPTTATIAKNTGLQFTATGTFSDGSTQNLSNEVAWSSSNGAVVSINGAGFATGNSAGSAQITVSYRGFSASTTSFQVTSATLVSLSFNPPNPSVAAGSNTQVTVTGTFSDSSTQNLTNNAYYSSSNLSAVTVSSAGVITGVAAGTSTITVQADGQTSSFTVTVTGATLSSIAITPTNPPSFAKGTTEQFTATGTYSDGSTQNLTTVVTWTSSNTSVITINTSGLATGTGVGSATITAAYQSKTATTPAVQVTAATVASIAVTPANQSINTGSTQQYTATATYTDATTQNVTSTVTWSSSSTTVATITSGGLAAGVAPGNTTIGAQLNSVSGSTTLTVTTPSAPTLTSITITPSSATIPSGSTQQFMATGNYSNGTTQNLTALASWQSSNTSVATVSSTGLATAVAAGNTQIYAFYQGQSANVVLTVSAATLSSLSVTPTTASIASGTTQQFTATGTLSDGSTQNLTNSATWSSSSQSVATINASGLATGEATGTTVITATVGSTTATASLTVTGATVLSLQLSPSSVTLATGAAQQLTATATFSNTTSQNVTPACTYSTSNAAVATVNSSGMVQAVAAGSATITATLGGSTATSSITVTSAALSSIAITPANPSLAAGTSQQLTATGTFTNGSTQNLTNSVTWSSSSTSTASVSTTGNLVAAHTGTATITATSGSITTTTTATITNAVVTTITISPSSATLAAGQTQQFTATATLSDGTQQNATSSAQWSVSDPTKATVSNTSGSNGLLTTNAAGSINLTATLNSVAGSAPVTITSATLSSLAVSPTPVTMVAGTTAQLTVTGTYSDNSSANLTSTATYSTSSSSVATVDSSGVVHGIGLGIATITVTVGSTTTTDAVTVDTATLNSITITPAAPTVPIGLTTQLTATGNYSDGSTANITSQVQWTSSTPAAATVSTTGLVTAKASGSTTITATMNSVTGTTAVTVTSAVLQSIAVQTTETSFPLGLSVQLTAIGTYSDSSTQNLTSSVTWSSQTPSVGVVNSSGLATGVTTGAFNAAATVNGVTGTLQLTVTSAALQSITVTPANQIIANVLGNPVQFTATGHYSDGTTQNITNSVHWSLSGINIGTISQTGSFSAVAVGLGTITATSGSISGSTNLTVISL